MKETRGRKKGTPKTGGRKKGVPNKVTLPLRDFITNFLTNNQHQIESDFKKLRPVQRLQMFERLAKYSLPTLQSVSAELSVDALDNLDEDRLLEIMDKIETWCKQ